MRQMWRQVEAGGWGTRWEEQTKMAQMLCDFKKLILSGWGLGQKE